METDLALQAVNPLKTYLFDSIKEYVSYILNCEDNMGQLRKSLKDACNKKGDVDRMLKIGKAKSLDASNVAVSWLHDVKMLSEDEELRSIMKRDFEVAKMMARLMDQRVLKRVVREDLDFQESVVKVLRELKEEMRTCDTDFDGRLVREEYEKLGQVVEEVVKESIEEFKKFLKKDRKMAMMALKMLSKMELEYLTEVDDDYELVDILWEAKYLSDMNFRHLENGEGEEESKVLLPVPVDEKCVIEMAARLMQPIGNLVTTLGMLMDDRNFQKAVPEVDSVKSGFDAIHKLFSCSRELSEELKESTKRQRSRCCCCAIDITQYHHRYQMSKAAKLKATYIQDNIIIKCPVNDNLTISPSPTDLNQTSNLYPKEVKSTIALLHLIVDKLKDGNMDVIGVFGMVGAGKTVLARKVADTVKDVFDKIVMVEVSNSPNVLRIQEEIALSIGLPLLEVDSIAQRANRLYNQISNKEKKTLVILDNICKKLNLDEVGIPRTCKLLLTTRDKEVCRVMGVQDGNIHEVGLLTKKEAKGLFKSQVGDRVHAGEYKRVVDRLINRCGGLLFAILFIATTLRDKDLPEWQKFADELDRRFSSQVNGEDRETYLILETIYKFMESEEKRLFFLLACLSPIGSSVSIEELMRYGIGLDLFQHVNKLSEAMEQANQWVEELVSSFMFVQGDSSGYVKIPDFVRSFAISFAAKDEGHKFMVEAVPRWFSKKNFGNYTAISLQSGGNFFCFNGVEAGKLQILLLKGNSASEFTDSFFERMLNLEVLALSRMNFSPRLPVSIGKLKKLRTLHLESCKLGDVKVIGELSSLVVLSLRESILEQELPYEVGNLSNLRLLDMSGCTSKLELIPAGILDRLSQLEGLYSLDICIYSDLTQMELFNHGEIITTKCNDRVVNANELNQLQYLNAIEMSFSQTAQLPNDAQFSKNLDMFRICVESINDAYTTAYILGCRRVLSIGFFDLVKSSCLMTLLKKADWLQLGCRNIEYLVPDFDEDGFRDLISLTVLGAENLKALCDRDAPSGLFQKLQNLTLLKSNKLEYMLPLAHLPGNLTHIQVEDCKSLNFFFIDNGNEIEEKDVIMELPLKSLQLSFASACQSLLGTNINHGLQGHQVFFNKKVALPCLELVSLKHCPKIIKLWSKEAVFPGFCNLREIKIESCDELINVGSASIFFALVQLESLTIKCCDKMQQVIAEETEQPELHDEMIVFPCLKFLSIESSSSLQCFYNGRSKLGFPCLETLRLVQLRLMNRFSGSNCSPATFFSEKDDFPSLEELQVIDEENNVKRLWDRDISTVDAGKTTMENHVPKLRKLTIS